MKKLLLAVFLSSSFMTALPQTNLVDSLQQRIDFLERRMDEKNYTRVPAGDFEKLLDNKVSSEVYNSIYKWIGFLALLIGIAGFLVSAYSRTLIKETVETVTDKKFADLQSKVEKINNELQRENHVQDEKLKLLQNENAAFFEAQKRFRDETASMIDERVNASTRIIQNNVAESIQSRAANLKFKGVELIHEINAFVDNRSFVISKETKARLIDTLVNCYYYSNELPAGENRYKRMIEIVNKYESEVDLLPETYVNAAIALTYQYDYYGVKSDRESALYSCEKSISRLQDYGTAYAVKLEVFAMDYKKAFDETEKNEALKNIQKTFKSIENNQSPHICKEIIERFKVDNEVPYLQPYISLLESLFPDAFIAIRSRIPVPENEAVV